MTNWAIVSAANPNFARPRIVNLQTATGSRRLQDFGM
jgi:hypothetical protein